MSARIRLKRGSTTSWANSSKDNKLSYGQPGIEIRAGKAPRLKVGNVNQDTAWASIPYICPDPEIYQDSQIGTSNNPLSNGYFNALTANEVLNIGLSEISNYSTNLDGTYGQNPLCVSTDQGTYELIFGGGKIGGLKNPSNDNDAANKKYVDDAIASATSSSDELLLDLVDTPFDSYENGFYYYVTLDEPLTLEIGVLYRVTFGGNSYIDTAYIHSDDIYLGNAQIYNNGAVNGAQPYFISKIGTTSSYQIIVYTGSTGDSDTVTIKIEKLGNNYANISGNAGTATKLQTARTIQTNLASTSSASFDGSKNITPGVTGTLPIANGGTNAITAADACANLGAVKKSGDTMTGTLTNTSTINIQKDEYPTLYFNNAAGNNKAAVICSAGAADHNGGIIIRGWNSDSSDYKELVLNYGNNMAVPVSNGGTGATTAANACSNLGAVKKSGDTMTGTLVNTSMITIRRDNYPSLYYENAAKKNKAALICAASSANADGGIVLRAFSSDSSSYKDIWFTYSVGLELPNTVYGSSLPSAGHAGRIFFKKV